MHTQLVSLTLLAGAVAMALFPHARAQKAADPTSSLDQIVVTATRIPEPLSEANANISVVTRDDLERMHMTALQEALRTIPGIQFLNYKIGRGRSSWNVPRLTKGIKTSR
jgi:vitamin B12 transporter